MAPRQLFRILPAAVLCLVPLLPAQSSAPSAGTAEPAMQLPPDQASFNRANTVADPRQRAAALSIFLHDFPKSRRADRARNIVLKLLIAEQPQDLHRIHEVAQSIVDTADKDSRANEENNVAYVLAEAPPNGVELKAAEGWARDSVDRSTEPKSNEHTRQMFANSKQPPPSAAVLHEIFASTQAANQQTLADVYVHEGKLDEATAALKQAQELNPTQGANFVTLGQIEHARHHDKEALDALESAEVYGGMTPATQDLLHLLYAAQHGGDSSGLEAEIDRRYQATFKALAPAAHTASTSGRTVLLALYTGSGCEPCAAADLATDAVLQTYPRSQVVALAFDQHVPEPDPLANPSTIARADYDGVHFTPTLRLNGTPFNQVGGDRSRAEKSYTALASALDKQLSVPSGVALHLAASVTAAHTVAATARVEVTDSAALQKLLTPPPPPTAASPAPATPAATGKAAPESAATKPVQQPKLVLNFALVQREVRYSGENGIRFHSMVVRDLAKPTADAFPVALTNSSSAAYTFDPAAISAALGTYLADFSRHSDRFGTLRFLSTDTALPTDDLAVAAWVEDLSSHQVVAAAYTPLAGSPTEQAAR